MATKTRRRVLSTGRLVTVGMVLGVALLVLAYVLLEGNLTEGFIDIRQWMGSVLHRYGSAASLALLYIEESGIPLPVPGDVYVLYLGRHAAGSAPVLFAIWLGIIAVVTAGSSNLYYISRRWGLRFLEHRLSRVFHLDPERLQKAKGWFDRYGVLAMIFGRHIPGFRVPLTFVAATLGFPYRLFAPSVAVSTAIWAGVFLLIGDRLGRMIGRFLGHNAWVYAVGSLFFIGAFVYFGFRARRVMSPTYKHN